MGQRVGEFDRMHAIVRDERQSLGLHIAAGKQRLAELNNELHVLVGLEDPQSRIRRGEIDNAIRLLDKRVGDLTVMQHAADQSLPMIRLIQATIQLDRKIQMPCATSPSRRGSASSPSSCHWVSRKNAVELVQCHRRCDQ